MICKLFKRLLIKFFLLCNFEWIFDFYVGLLGVCFKVCLNGLRKRKNIEEYMNKFKIYYCLDILVFLVRKYMCMYSSVC